MKTAIFSVLGTILGGVIISLLFRGWLVPAIVLICIGYGVVEAYDECA